MSQLAPELKTRIVDAARATPAPTRRQQRRRLSVALVGAREGPMGSLVNRASGRTRWALPALTLGALSANLVTPETRQMPILKLSRYVSCALLTIAIGVAIAYLVVRYLRGADPLAPRATGRALGAAAGSAAALAASAACPCIDPVHMLVGHVLPVAIVASIGAVLGGRMLTIAWGGAHQADSAELRK